MTDLDAAIRERISEREPIDEWPGFAYVAVQALLEVLDHIGQCEFFADELEGDDLLRIVARELGVSDD